MRFFSKKLPNGLTLVTIPMADATSATVLVMVSTGSKYETKETNGISHFLEHMVFKGTPRRPKASDISRELDSIGAQYNAFTSHEYTGYYAKADARHLDTILDVVSDMCQNPLFDEKEIAKEKGVIIEELRMYRDLPQRHVHDVLARLMHGDQPAGWDVIGIEETIKSFSRDSLLVYRNDHYVAEATTVIVSGSFDERSIAQMVGDAFSRVPNAPKKGKLKVAGSQAAPMIRIEPKETDQAHLAIAVRAYPILDPKVYPLAVLSAILGSGMSSRLFQKMRDELGICYYVSSSQNPYTDHGDLTISAGVDTSRVREAVRGILGECSRLKHELVPPEELQKAKDYIAGGLMLSLETSDARAEYAGLEQVLKGAIESPDDYIRKIAAVSASDVQAVAREIFRNEGLNMAIVGRTERSIVEPLLEFS